jgi:hypothetical protein
MSTETETPRPSLAHALALLAVVVVVIAGYIAAATALGVAALYLGFLFLLYWTGVEGAKLERWAPCAIGVFVGLGLAFLLHALPTQFGAQTGIIAFLGLIAAITVLMIMRIGGLVFNLAAMLVLTVAAAPEIHAQADWPQMFASLAFGVAYFSAVVFVLQKAAARFAAKPAQAAAS